MRGDRWKQENSMTLRTLTLTALSLVAGTGAALAQPIVDTDTDEQNIQRIMDWASVDDEHTDAAARAVGKGYWGAEFEEDETADPNFAGIYELSSGVTLSVLANSDGTYRVTRTQGPLTLKGTGTLSKNRNLSNKSVLAVKFPNEKGAAGVLATLTGDETLEGPPSATYFFDPKISFVRGTFYSDQSHENAGSYEAGWRKGAKPLTFASRTGRDFRTIVWNVNRKARFMIRTTEAQRRKRVLVRKELVKRIKAMRRGGKDVHAGLRSITRDMRVEYKNRPSPPAGYTFNAESSKKKS